MSQDGPSLTGSGFRMPPRKDNGPSAKSMHTVATSPGLQQAGIISQMFPDMPDWAVALSQQVTLLQVELAAISVVLQERHVTNDFELSRTRAEIQSAFDSLMQDTAMQMGRTFAQQPNAVTAPKPSQAVRPPAPPTRAAVFSQTDPRRPPTHP